MRTRDRLSARGRDIREQYPDKFKKFTEALNKSKGKTNNNLALSIALMDNITVDDIVKFANEDNIDNIKENTILESLGGDVYHKNDGDFVKWDYSKGEYVRMNQAEIEDKKRHMKAKKFDDKHKFKFKDTYVYRLLTKAGINPENDDNLNVDTTYDNRAGTSRKGYGLGYVNAFDANYDSNVKKTLLFFKLDEHTRKKLKNDEALKKLWFEVAYTNPHRYYYGAAPKGV